MQSWSVVQLIGTKQHARDDYRSAVSLIKEYHQPGQLTVIMANLHAYAYYDPSVYNYAKSVAELKSHDLHGNAGLVLQNPSPAEWQSVLETWSGPILVLLGKPYFHDSTGVVRQWLQQDLSSELIGTPATFELWRVNAGAAFVTQPRKSVGLGAARLGRSRAGHPFPDSLGRVGTVIRLMGSYKINEASSSGVQVRHDDIGPQW
jgi:hypothetical protein